MRVEVLSKSAFVRGQGPKLLLVAAMGEVLPDTTPPPPPHHPTAGLSSLSWWSLQWRLQRHCLHFSHPLLHSVGKTIGQLAVTNLGISEGSGGGGLLI